MAESEMVERVARAMEPGAFATYDLGYTAMNWRDQRAFLNAEKVVKRTRKKARDAIEAMRKPTEAMMASCGNGECAKWAPGAWESYIDAALGQDNPNET